MINLSQVETGFKVLLEDRLLCGCINLVILEYQAKSPKFFTSSHQELPSKAVKDFIRDDPKSFSILR